MNKVFTIVKIDFDNMENRLYSAIKEKTIGFKLNKEEAQKYIEEHCKNISSYKGWDGEKYPKFTVEEINRL